MCVQTMQPWPFNNVAPMPLDVHLLEKLRTPTPATSASIFMAWPCHLSAVRLGDHLDRGVAVAAHPEVLEHVDGRSGWHGKQPERHGKLLRLSNKFNSSHTS